MTASLAQPFSNLASPQAGAAARAKAESDRFLATVRARWAAEGLGPEDAAVKMRGLIDELSMRPGLEAMLEAFPVQVAQADFGGVTADVVTPMAGVPGTQSGRVLIALFGGGYASGRESGGIQNAVPVACLGGLRVVAPRYRLWPEHVFPAASEDVAAVYAALLREYPAASIGMFGCSAGGFLVSQATAWIRDVGLPRPGAIGVFHAGGELESFGDSNRFVPFLTGHTDPMSSTFDYLRDADLSDPLVSPGRHRQVLADFPPTLVLTGTRDLFMSTSVRLHADLVAAGADARLHVWEGMGHCSFSQGMVDLTMPENREAWRVIVDFFDQHLGA